MKIHFVKKGETLSEIAQKYGLTLEQLLAANPSIQDPDVIEVGAKLTIPQTQGNAANPSAGINAPNAPKTSTAPKVPTAPKASTEPKVPTAPKMPTEPKTEAAEEKKAPMPKPPEKKAVSPAFPLFEENIKMPQMPLAEAKDAMPILPLADANEAFPMPQPISKDAMSGNIAAGKSSSQWGDVTPPGHAVHPFAAKPGPAWPAGAMPAWPQPWTGSAGAMGVGPSASPNVPAAYPTTSSAMIPPMSAGMPGDSSYAGPFAPSPFPSLGNAGFGVPYYPEMNSPAFMPVYNPPIHAPYNTPYATNYLNQPMHLPPYGDQLPEGLKGEMNPAYSSSGADQPNPAAPATAGKSEQKPVRTSSVGNSRPAADKKRKPSLGEKVAKLHATRKSKR